MPDYDGYGDCPWGYNDVDYQEVEKVIIGDGITKIGKSNFEGGNKIKTVILPDTLKEIEEYAFYNCTSVESMTLPDELDIVVELFPAILSPTKPVNSTISFPLLSFT